MAIIWNTPQGIIINDYEETTVNKEITVTSDNGVKVEKISGKIPDGVILTTLYTENKFLISGVLPIVNEITHYYFTLKATDIVTNEVSERYFEIIVKNKTTDWDEQPDSFTIIETAYTTIQLNLINAEHNETFVKIAGEMPTGLQINSNGLIYGVVNDIDVETTFYFTIGVMRNKELILEKDFNIIVLPLSSTSEPVWITESGVIGNVNYLEDSTLFVSAYDPQKLPISYKLGNESNLPTGLSLNSTTGRITGTCETQYGLDWTFTIIVSNGRKEVGREFTITTNALSEEDKMEWEEPLILDNAQIGKDYVETLKVKSYKPVVFSIIGGSLPSGLSMNNKGEINGVVSFQDKKTYKFTVFASNGVTYLQREFSIDVVKGLGKNAVEAYFYINNEYLTDYQNMRELFNVSNAYKQNLSLYHIFSKPVVEICQMSTFDKILIRFLFESINTPITYNWKYTVKQDYSEDGETKYSVFYKQIVENIVQSKNVEYSQHPYIRTYVDEKITYYYTGTKNVVTPTSEVIEETVKNSSNPDIVTKLYYFVNEDGVKVYVDKEITYYKEGTTQLITPTSEVWMQVIEGKEYVILDNNKIYIEHLSDNDYYIDTTKEIVYSDEQIFLKQIVKQGETLTIKYVVRNEEELEVIQTDSTMLANLETGKLINATTDNTTIERDKSVIRYYFDDSSKFSMFLGSTNYIRECLNEKIYVEKLNQEKVYYKKGNQEIIDDDFSDKEFMVYWDEERKTYYVKFNGEIKYFNIYAKNDNDPSGTIEKVYASIDKDVTIIDGGHSDTGFVNVIEGGDASTTSFDDIIDTNDDRYEVKELMVAQDYYDTDIDYHYYIVYEKGTMNMEENILFTLSWKPDVKFVILNGSFYMVDLISNPYIYKPEDNSQIGFDKIIVLPYVTDDDIFEDEDKPYVKFFDMDTEILPAWKTSYYPTLDLFYSQPNTNVVALTQINQRERQGDYWTGRKFIFYEVHFNPLFNENIDNFTIDFYNHNNENSPEFQLI